MKIPKELQVPNIPLPTAAEILSQAEHVLSVTTPTASSDRSSASGDASTLAKALITIAGQAWRQETALTDRVSSETKLELSTQEIRKLANALDAIKQAIEELGIRVKDRCNEDFHAGLPDQVITEEPREGISKERIIRTIRPTIFWHQTMVQRGEIDIAVPISKP
jgi:hypothetical protein